MPSLSTLAIRATAIGVAAGLRSMTPFGVLASEHRNASVPGTWRDWPVVRSKPGRIALQLAWIGELIGDKVPGVPPRINPGPLGGRILFGALAGTALGTQGTGSHPKLIGAVFGAAGALAGSYAGYTYRTTAAKQTGFPDLPFALVEDAAAWAIAEKALRG